MLSRILILGSVGLFFAGCSHFGSKNEATLGMAGSEKDPADLVDKSLEKKISRELQTSRDAHDHKSCEGCIVGSSSNRSLQNNEKRVYFLYGAEELNLQHYYFDIPVVYNDATKKWIRYFVSRGKDFFIRYSERAGRYAPVLSKILEQHKLPKDLIFMAMAESGFQNHAKSWAKAVGPWQFMPFTGRKYGLEIDWYTDERQDPIKASISAANYLQDLYERFGHWELAMAGYNAGEGKVSRAIRRYRTDDFWKLRKHRYLARETKEYVPKIMALAIIGKNLESFGMGHINFEAPLDFEEIELPPNTDLFAVAEALGTDYPTLRKYNPEVRRWMTPPHRGHYQLRVPLGLSAKWSSCCSGTNYSEEKLSALENYQTYTMNSRSSLGAVAKKFRLPATVLTKLNSSSTHQRFAPGEQIKLPFRIGQGRRDKMYADLYELPPRRVRRKRSYQGRIRVAARNGKAISNPSVYYTVKKGDSLWTVSRKTGVPLNNLIKTNLGLVKKRMIMPGDQLAIR